MPKSLIAANVIYTFYRLFCHATTLASLHLRVKGGEPSGNSCFCSCLKRLPWERRPPAGTKISHWIARRHSWENPLGRQHLGYGTKKKFWRVLVKEIVVPFEGFQFDAMENADGYLRCVYGNYMTPLPPEKRITTQRRSEIYIKNLCSVS